MSTVEPIPTSSEPTSVPPAPPALPDKVAVALMMLPGFISERVAAYYSTQPKLSEVETIASALCFTLINAAIALTLVQLVRSVMRWKGLPTAHRPIFTPAFIVLLVLTSLGTGMGWAVLDARDLLFGRGNWRLTDRESRHTVWERVFADTRRRAAASKPPDPSRPGSVSSPAPEYAVVVLATGRTYHGHTRYNAPGDEDAAIFLQPAWVEIREDPSNKWAPPLLPRPLRCVELPRGVLILKDAIRVVEFREKKTQHYKLECETSGIPPVPGKPAD